MPTSYLPTSYPCEHCEASMRDAHYCHHSGCPCLVSPCDTCKRRKRNARARRNRQARESSLRSCGLVKVRGALGGIYWE